MNQVAAHFEVWGFVMRVQLSQRAEHEVTVTLHPKTTKELPSKVNDKWVCLRKGRH